MFLKKGKCFKYSNEDSIPKSKDGKVKGKKKCVSPAGNRTPVSRVTGGDTHHYTTEDSAENNLKY